MPRRLISATGIIAVIVIVLSLGITLSTNRSPATADAAPAPQAVDPNDRFGNGSERDRTVRSGETFNPNTALASVNAAGTDAAPGTSIGFTPGDLVLFHQSQGPTDVGRWEFNTIATIISPTSWTLSQPLAYRYTTDTASNRAQVIRVPQYHNLTVQAGGTVKGPDWNGSVGGLLVFKVSQTLDVAGTIVMSGGNGVVTGDTFPPGGSGGGYRGGKADLGLTDCQGGGWQGEGTAGVGTDAEAANGNGGSGGHYKDSGCVGAAGSGGGNRTIGVASTLGFFSSRIGGNSFGNTELTILAFGGGGGGAANESGRSGGSGGAGGGAMILFARNLNVTGHIVANGGSGAGSQSGGGGGAGGSIYIRADKATLGVNPISALGGSGGSSAGAGGEGRIRVETCAAPPTPNPISQAASVVQVECIAPTAAFIPPIPERHPYGMPLTLRWEGSDNESGSGIRGFTLRQSIEGGPLTDSVRETSAREHDIILDHPCRVVTFTLTATDNADNLSPPVMAHVQAVLQGDVNVDGEIDPSDLSAMEGAVGLSAGQPGYRAQLDINADGRVDSADVLWLRRHIGDRCPAVVP